MEMVFILTLAASTFFPYTNQLSTVRYCKFLRLFSLVLKSDDPLPPPFYLPSVTPVGFDKHVILQQMHVSIHTELHTHSHLQAQM